MHALLSKQTYVAVNQNVQYQCIHPKTLSFIGIFIASISPNATDPRHIVYDQIKQHTFNYSLTKATRRLEPITWRGVLLSTLVHATV
jgi:hypothetical protein